MAKENPPKSRYLKSERISLAASSPEVDRENRIIPGVILCQAGPAKGHGVHLEQSFIDDGIAYAKRHYAKVGMKSRFGHPSMSNDALGTEVGRFRDFRVEDDKMVADLHIYKSANLSPTHPGAGDWILSMADEDPAAIMCSIVFTVDHFYQYGEKEKPFKVKIDYSDYSGKWVSAEEGYKYDPKKKVYVKLKEFMFTDLVDDGAATDKLFSALANKDKFAVVATEFLDEHPKIAEFLMDNPQKLGEFLDKYKQINSQTNKQSKQGMKIKFQKAWAFALAFFGLADTKEDELPEVTAEHFGKLNDECVRLSAELGETSKKLGQADKDKEALQAQVDALEEDKSSLSEKNKALETKLAQEKKDKDAYCALAEKYRTAAGKAFTETKGDPDPIQGEGGDDDKKFADYSVNKRAMEEIENI